MLYSRAEEFELPSRDVLDFFSEIAPCGVIGSFLEDKTNNIADHFAFKHHYIYSTSVNVDTLDEAPMAYKSLADIIDVIRDSVEIIDIMKPVYNFKASDKKFHAL